MKTLALLLLTLLAAAHASAASPLERELATWSNNTLDAGAALRALQSNNFAALNNILQGVKFGPEPGPCPTSDQRCAMNWNDAPDWVKASIVRQGNKAAPLSYWVRGGDFFLYYLICSDLALNGVTLANLGTTSADGTTKTRAQLDIRNLKMRCNAKGGVRNLRFVARYLVGFVGAFGETWGYWEETEMRGKVDADVISFVTNPGSEGVELTAKFDVFRPTRNPGEEEPPSEIRFVLFDGCTVSIPRVRLQGLSYDFNNPTGALLTFFNSIFPGIFDGIFKDMMTAMIQSIICGLMQGLAYTNNGGTRGPVNVFLNDMKEDIDALRAEDLRTRPDFEGDDATMPSRLQNLGLPSTWVDFRTDELFEALSVGLNKYLGENSTIVGGPHFGTPAVNEFVDGLNGDGTGVVEIADIRETFQLRASGVPSFSFGDDISFNTLALKGVRMEGLNTFRTWQALDNGYADRVAFGPAYQHTLLSAVRLERFRLRMIWDWVIRPGNWMTTRPWDERVQSFAFDVSFEDLDVSAATLALVQLDNLWDLQVGQLFAPEQTAGNVFNCALRAVDHFRFSGLRGSASLVQLEGADVLDLGNLMINLVNFANVFYQPIIERDLPYVLENVARLEVNDWLDNTFFRGALPECPRYEITYYEGPEQWFNLADSLALDFVQELVTKLVGGEPVTQNSLDINNLIQGALEYIVFDRPDGAAINDDPASAYKIASDFRGSWRIDDKIEVLSLVGDDKIRIDVRGPGVEGLDSIWRLRILEDPTNDYAIGFNLTWGDGEIARQTDPVTYMSVEPIRLQLPIAINANVSGTQYADEDFSLTLQLQLQMTGTLEARFVRYLVFDTPFRNFLSLSCVLATLDRKSLRQFEIALNDFSFAPTFPNGGGFSGFPLGEALEAWRSRLQNDPSSRATTQHFLNFVLNRVEVAATELLDKEFEEEYLTHLCLEQPSPLNGTLFAAPLPVPNFTAWNIALNKALTPQRSVLGDDPRIWERPMFNGEPVFDVTAEENQFVALVASATTAESLRSLLRELADTEVDPELPSILDPLYSVFVREADNSTTLRLDINRITTVNFEPDVEGLVPGLALRFSDLIMTNVDGFDSLSFLEPYESDAGERAKITTYHALRWAPNATVSLTFGFEVELAAEAIDPLALPDALVSDSVLVTINMTGFQMEALLAIAVNQTDLAAVDMGELIFFNETSHAFQLRPDAYNCTIKRVLYEEGVFWPLLQGNVTNITGPDIVVTTNFLSAELADAATVAVEMFLEMVRTHVPDVTQGPLRDFVNNAFFEILYFAEYLNECVGTQLPDFDRMGGKTLNLTRSAFGPDLAALVSVDLLNPNSALNINTLLARFVNDVPLLEFEVLPPSDVLYNGLDLGLSSVAISGFKFEDLGTGGPGDARVEDMTILDNTVFGYAAPYTTRSTFETSGEFEFSFAFAYSSERLFVDAGGRRQLSGTRPVTNQLRLGVRFHDTSFDTNLTTRVDIERVLKLKVGNLLDLYFKPSQVSCLLSVFEEGGLVLEAFEFEVSLLELTARCEGVCDSPMFARLADAGGITDPTTSGDITDGFNSLLSGFGLLVGASDAQSYIDLLVLEARSQCTGVDFPFGIPDLEGQTDAASILGYAGLGLVGGTVAGFMMLLPRHRDRRQRIMRLAFDRLNTDKTGGVAGKGPQLMLIEQRLAACYQHPILPRGARFGVPLSIVLAVALFLAANIDTVGASVSIVLSLGGDTTVPLPVLEFTLATSINDMWNSGTYFLALVIFLFSGAWPHAKSLLLLFAWFAPPTVLPQRRRGAMLEVLDTLGKWALFDAYVLIMLQVAFRFYLSSSTVELLAFLDTGLFVVDVIVAPGASIYLLVCGTIVALSTNHYMIHLHRKMLASDMALEDQIEGIAPEGLPPVKRALMRHVFLVPDTRGLLFGFSASAKLTVASMLTLSALLVGVGSFLPLITFDYQGVAGALLAIAEPALKQRTFSAVSIAMAIRDGILKEDIAAQAGVVFLQIIYLSFTLITPLGLMGLFAFIWLKPLTPGDQRRMLFIAQLVAAWEALIVLLAAVLVAASEVSTLAKFVVRGIAGQLCGFITDPLIALGISPSDAACFDVKATVQPESTVLILGSLLTLATTLLMFRLLGPALLDREHQRMGRLDKLGHCPRSAKGNWPAAVILRNAVQPVSRIRRQGADVGPIAFDNVDVADARATSSNPQFVHPADV